MHIYSVEYEIPPLRAIYGCEVDADSEEDVRQFFSEDFPNRRIRKVVLVQADTHP